MSFRLTEEQYAAHCAGKGTIAREAEILPSVLALLRAHPAVAIVWRASTGAARYAGADGGVRYVSYGFKGCSDVLGCLRGSGRLFAFEVKRPGEKPTEAQTEFLEAVRGAGGIGAVVYGIDDVLRELPP